MTMLTFDLSKTFAKRALHKLARDLSPRDHQLARCVADCLGENKSVSTSVVLDKVWPGRSPASARKALTRLRSRIGEASGSTKWPLNLVIKGRGPTSTVCFHGRYVEFTATEMGIPQVLCP